MFSTAVAIRVKTFITSIGSMCVSRIVSCDMLTLRARGRGRGDGSGGGGSPRTWVAARGGAGATGDGWM